MDGQVRCDRHGGKTPRALAAAERREAEARVQDELVKAVGTYGLPRDVDPGVALLEEVRRTAGHVAWLGQKVGALREDQLFIVGAFGSFLNPYVTQYQRERTHHARICADAVRCGLEARQVALAERIGEQVYAAMRGFALEMGLNPDDPRVAASGVKHLRLIGDQERLP